MATAPAPAPVPMLQKDPDLIERLEKDLMTKAQAAFEAAGVDAGLHGIFSLDQLEQINERELCRKIAVGIGYLGAEPGSVDAAARSGQNPGSVNAARVVDFVFAAILAVPTEEQCGERHNATKLLTIMRRSIIGSSVAGDQMNRKWMFVREAPNVGESDTQMLYYSQQWRLAIAETSNLTN